LFSSSFLSSIASLVTNIVVAKEALLHSVDLVEVSTTAVAVVAADSEDSVDLEAEVSAVVEPAEVGKNKLPYSIKKDDRRYSRPSFFYGIK
jgi:hypothetical protein